MQKSLASNTSIGVAGLGLGWLVGMSVSPVIEAVVTSLIGLVVLFCTAASGLKESSSLASKIGLEAKPMALLLVGIAMGSMAGYFCRINACLGPYPSIVGNRLDLLAGKGGHRPLVPGLQAGPGVNLLPEDDERDLAIDLTLLGKEHKRLLNKLREDGVLTQGDFRDLSLVYGSALWSSIDQKQLIFLKSSVELTDSQERLLQYLRKKSELKDNLILDSEVQQP